MHLEHSSSIPSWQESELGSEGHSGTSCEQEPDPGGVTGTHSQSPL